MSVEGRWTLMVTSAGHAPGAASRVDGGALMRGWSAVPVVPCCDAAIERAAAALSGHPAVGDWRRCRELAELVLRAAGETPS